MKYFIFIIVFSISTFSYSECPDVSGEAEFIISEHIKKIKGGESCKYRNTYQDNGIEFVVYTVSGPCFKVEAPHGSCGNKYFSYLTGIVGGSIYYPTVVGAKGDFHIHGITYNNGAITLEGLSYSKKDSMCCPTISSTRKYEISSSKLVKIQP
jgi:hypothetical protein